MTVDLNFYPFNNAIILTDSIYTEYGGNVANSTANQRQVGYWLAEMKVSEDIDTYLSVVTRTGTFHYHPQIMLDNNYVHRIIITRFIDYQENIYYSVSGTANIYVAVDNAERGVVDVASGVRNCHCHTKTQPFPYKVQIVYETGLSSGTVYRPDMLLALTTYAQIIINEVVGFGNESPGDAGVSEYSNQEYREKRKGLINTVFGQSPKANFAWRLLTRYRKYKNVGLGERPIRQW